MTQETPIIVLCTCIIIFMSLVFFLRDMDTVDSATYCACSVVPSKPSTPKKPAESFVDDDDDLAEDEKTSTPEPRFLRVCTNVNGNKICTPRVRMSDSIHIFRTNGTLILQGPATAASKGGTIGRAWPPLSNSDMNFDVNYLSKAMMGKPLPCTPLLNYTNIRVDTRPLKACIPLPEVYNKYLPTSVTLNGEKYVKKLAEDVVYNSKRGDILGLRGTNGDLDLQMFVTVYQKDIFKNAILLEKIARTYHKVGEWIQDRIYEMSKQRMRYTRVFLTIIGVSETKGTYVGPFGSVVNFNLVNVLDCNENDKALIKMMCDHAANQYKWDRTYARQRLVFRVDNPTEQWACTSSETSTGCIGGMCQSLYATSVSRLNAEIDWFENPQDSECTILHEMMHSLNLFHANKLDSRYEEEYRDANTGVMGFCRSYKAGPRLNPLNMHTLGWLNRRTFVDLDSLTQEGIVITVPSTPDAYVVLHCPIVVVQKMNLSFSGQLPYPVLTLAVMKRNSDGTVNRCVMHTYGGAQPQDRVDALSMQLKGVGHPLIKPLTYLIPTELGIETPEVKVDLFHPKLGSFLPPYVYNQSFSPLDAKPLLSMLNLSLNNKRINMSVKVQLEGPYSGQGDMRVRISRV